MCRKMQKSPAFQAGDELFYWHSAWFSSIGSHMGQQTGTNLLFFGPFTHTGRLLFAQVGLIITWKLPFVDSRLGIWAKFQA